MSKESWQLYLEQQTVKIKRLESTNPSFSPYELFDRHVAVPESLHLGQVVLKRDIQSLMFTPDGQLVQAEFKVLPEYKTYYPEVIIKALSNLYAEYNKAFVRLVEANREWETDYRYSIAPNGIPINGWVQIDMVGLPDSFLKVASSLDEQQVQEVLRRKIFEIENSLAMYQLLELIFSSNGEETFFRKNFRNSLNNLRKKHNKEVALLAVTEQKYQSMRESEFGKRVGEPLTCEEVRELSGFDRFFGPQDFEQYLIQNRGKCDYLLYARTSDPVAKLKRPELKIEVPLLENDYTRRIIKENALTFNVDNPNWVNGDLRKINDTKAWMSALGMAFDIYRYEDAVTIVEKRGEKGNLQTIETLSDGLVNYLKSQGVDFSAVDPREIILHAKPMQASYGCYGHTRGTLSDREFRRELRKGLRLRGPYVIQPEIQTPTVFNLTDGQSYTYIDRIFMWTDGENYNFMGGFRSLMPIDSIEARKGRNHGSSYTVWAEILPE